LFVVSVTIIILILWGTPLTVCQIGRTSLPVPKVFAYSSEANPVGVEWVLMEYMPGVELREAWKELDYDMKIRFAIDLVDMYDQLSQLKADACGAIYHSTRHSKDILLTSSSQTICSPRWKPLSSSSIRTLRAHCDHPLCDSDGLYQIGPLQDGALLQYAVLVPSPSQTPLVFTTADYVRLLAYNGSPSTRSSYDKPTRDKVVKLFQNLHALYPHHQLFGPSADPFIFRFCHGDLHDRNILYILSERSGIRPPLFSLGHIHCMEYSHCRMTNKPQ
jgi:hypothetical protein